MKFVESPDFTAPEMYTIHDVGVSTLALFGTVQLEEAARSEYKDFNLAEVRCKIKSILQLQLYLLYRWALTRFVISHNIKGSFIKQKFFDVTPDSFQPDLEDIDLYFEKPAFLWRLSAFNYKELCLLFFSKSKECLINLKTYNMDSSNMLEYVETKPSFFSRPMFQSPPTNLARIDTIQGYFKYNLSKYEQSEIYFSQDYFLHMMDGTTCYNEFVKILLTGLCERYKCGLYKLSLKNDNEKLFQFTTDFYAEPKAIISQFVELVKVNKENTILQNKLVVESNWVGEALLTTMFPSYTFARLLRRIFGNKLMIENFRWQDKCGNNVIIGTKLPCSTEKEVWLLLKYFTLRSQFPWLNCFMYTGRKISKETFGMIEKEFKKIEKTFYKLSQSQAENDVLRLCKSHEIEAKSPIDERSKNSPQSTISSIFDTTFHRNRRKFDNVKTIYPRKSGSLGFVSSGVSTTNTEIATIPYSSSKVDGSAYNECFAVQNENLTDDDEIVSLRVSEEELNGIDLTWSLCNNITGDTKPFTKIHCIVNDMMEFTLDLMEDYLQQEADRMNLSIIRPESIAAYLTEVNIRFNPRLIHLGKNINLVKLHIMKASPQHKNFVENLFKMLMLKELFNKIVEKLTVEELEKFPYSNYSFEVQIDEFKDLLDSFSDSTDVDVRWFIKPNGFIELLGF